MELIGNSFQRRMDLDVSPIKMPTNLQDEVATVVGAYKKGIICQGEVVNKMVDFAAYTGVSEILALLPQQFQDLLRERGEELVPPFEDYLFIESDCSTAGSDEYKRRREEARQIGIRGLMNVYEHFHPKSQTPG